VKLILYSGVVFATVVLGSATAGTFLTISDEDVFHQHDNRVFRSTACTRDHRPVEALYYIAASRSDMARGTPSPSSQLMNEEVDKNWRHIASRLTGEQITEERFAGLYHSILSETIPLLQQAVEQSSGVTISISEINSRAMDPAKDKDVPACGSQ
jgi:hypothetical protein